MPILLSFFIFQIYLVNSLRYGSDNLKTPSLEEMQAMNRLRRTDSSNYEPLRMFIDKTHIENQARENLEYASIVPKILNSIDEVANWFRNLINIIPSGKVTLRVARRNIIAIGITSFDENLDESKGIDTDIVIIPAINDTISSIGLGGGFQPTADGRNDVGIMIINSKAINWELPNVEEELKIILFHEITHILVFQDTLFSKFLSGNPVKIKMVDGKERNFIASQAVLEKGRNHFNCPTLEGILLEDQGGKGSEGVHWEAKIMLGDYMVAGTYSEVVISEITLALFEDSGWYKVNYYTGGLFRFGKGKGCSFLESKCISNENTQFPNEFCVLEDEYRCTAGHLNRGLCNLINLSYNLPSEYVYFPSKGNQYGGYYEVADYCPVTDDILNGADGYRYYSGSCKIGIPNYRNVLAHGEIIGDNSLCFVSSLTPKNTETLSKGRGTCYEVDCDFQNKNLKIKINNLQIICEKEEELINPGEFVGKIQCPDFNSVCTSSVFCNDIGSCINKKAVPIEECSNGLVRNLDETRCVSSCEEGAIINSTINKCVCDRSHPIMRFDKSKCISSPSECEDGSFANLALTQCVKSCESGSLFNQQSNKCICGLTHPILRFDKSKCISSPSDCDKGYLVNLLGTECVPKDSCEPGTEADLQSNSCVCSVSAPIMDSNRTGCLNSSLNCQNGEYANNITKICTLCPNKESSNLLHSGCISADKCGINAKSESNQCVCENSEDVILPDYTGCSSSCPDGYIIKNKVCSLCPIGTYIELSECKPCELNSCLECEKNTVVNQVICKRCQNGFFLENNICKKCKDGCLNCNSTEICTECEEGLELKNNKCMGNKEEINIVFTNNDLGTWNKVTYYYSLSKYFSSENKPQKEEAFNLQTNDNKNPLRCVIRTYNRVECSMAFSPSTSVSKENNILRIQENKTIETENIIYNITVDNNFMIKIDESLFNEGIKKDSDFLVTSEDFEKTQEPISLSIHSISDFIRIDPSINNIKYSLLGLISNQKIPNYHSFSLALKEQNRRRNLQDNYNSRCTLDQIIPIQMISNSAYVYYDCEATIQGNKFKFSGLNPNEKIELAGKDQIREDLVVIEGNSTLDGLKLSLFDKANILNKLSIIPDSIKRDNNKQITFSTIKEDGRMCPETFSITYFVCNTNISMVECGYTCITTKDVNSFGEDKILKSELSNNVYLESPSKSWNEIPTYSSNQTDNEDQNQIIFTPSSSSGLKGGYIALIVIVWVLLLIAIAALIIILLNRKKTTSEENEKFNVTESNKTNTNILK